MQLIENARDLKTVLKNINNGIKLGFVPTMGSLHQGHLQLIKTALAQNDCVVVSIFVNKRQFNDPKDFDQYPKTLHADCELILSVSDEIIVYAPASANEIFPENFENIGVNLGGIENEMEGEHRPGHFQGVIDVVHQFFKQISPSNAYFGEKDFQQLAVVKMLAQQHFPKLKIVGIPTARNQYGLALSSRNALLKPTELKTAEALNQSLLNIANQFYTSDSNIINAEQRHLESLGFTIDYIAVADSDTLKTAHEAQQKGKLRVFAAVFLGGVRLIDNMAIKA